MVTIVQNNILTFVPINFSKMKKLITIIIFTGLIFQAFSQSREVPFTLDDRDRIMRTEEKLEAMQGEMNVKFESLRNEMNSRFEGMEVKLDANNSKFEPLYWAFGILFTIILFTLGYIIWDRRTALYPVQDKTRSLEERVNKLEFITKQQAKKDPVFAEILKLAGLF